jgi:hypothetical protein
MDRRSTCPSRHAGKEALPLGNVSELVSRYAELPTATKLSTTTVAPGIPCQFCGPLLRNVEVAMEKGVALARSES